MNRKLLILAVIIATIAIISIGALFWITQKEPSASTLPGIPAKSFSTVWGYIYQTNGNPAANMHITINGIGTTTNSDGSYMITLKDTSLGIVKVTSPSTPEVELSVDTSVVFVETGHNARHDLRLQN
jgi:hypothetical protein